jgi:hypothetical protein
MNLFARTIDAAIREEISGEGGAIRTALDTTDLES